MTEVHREIRPFTRRFGIDPRVGAMVWAWWCVSGRLVAASAGAVLALTFFLRVTPDHMAPVLLLARLAVITALFGIWLAALRFAVYQDAGIRPSPFQFPPWQFRLPVRSGWLVAVHLALCLGCIGICIPVLLLGIAVIHNPQIPVQDALSPTVVSLFASSVLAGTAAILVLVWLTGPVGKVQHLAAMAALFGGIVVYVWTYAFSRLWAVYTWFRPGVVVPAALVVLLLCYPAGRWALRFDRRGKWERAGAYTTRDARVAGHAEFSGDRAAQSWYEARMSGWLFPILFAVFALSWTIQDVVPRLVLEHQVPALGYGVSPGAFAILFVVAAVAYGLAAPPRWSTDFEQRLPRRTGWLAATFLAARAREYAVALALLLALAAVSASLPPDAFGNREAWHHPMAPTVMAQAALLALGAKALAWAFVCSPAAAFAVVIGYAVANVLDGFFEMSAQHGFITSVCTVLVIGYTFRELHRARQLGLLSLAAASAGMGLWALSFAVGVSLCTLAELPTRWYAYVAAVPTLAAYAPLHIVRTIHTARHR